MGIFVRERLKKLDNEVAELREEIRQLKESRRPIYVDTATAARLFSVSISWLSYRLQTGQLNEVAIKTQPGRGGKWLIHCDCFEAYLRKEL